MEKKQDLTLYKISLFTISPPLRLTINYSQKMLIIKFLGWENKSKLKYAKIMPLLSLVEKKIFLKIFINVNLNLTLKEKTTTKGSANNKVFLS